MTPSKRRRVVLRLLLIAAALVALLAWHASLRHPTGPMRESFTPPATTSPTPDQFTIATFNIRRGKDATGYVELQDTLEAAGADMIGLNEVAAATHWGRPDQAAQLGRRLDMTAIYLPSQRRYYRDYFGNALLSRYPVLNYESIPLVYTEGHGHRNLTTAKLQLGDRTLTVLITHLDRGVDQHEQMRSVLEAFVQHDTAVLMGDLNALRTNEQLATLLETNQAIDAMRVALGREDWDGRIDWILVRGLDVVDAGVIDRGASDHPCYWATLSFRP